MADFGIMFHLGGVGSTHYWNYAVDVDGNFMWRFPDDGTGIAAAFGRSWYYAVNQWAAVPCIYIQKEGWMHQLDLSTGAEINKIAMVSASTYTAPFVVDRDGNIWAFDYAYWRIRKYTSNLSSETNYLLDASSKMRTDGCLRDAVLSIDGDYLYVAGGEDYKSIEKYDINDITGSPIWTYQSVESNTVFAIEPDIDGNLYVSSYQEFNLSCNQVASGLYKTTKINGETGLRDDTFGGGSVCIPLGRSCSINHRESRLYGPTRGNVNLIDGAYTYSRSQYRQWDLFGNRIGRTLGRDNAIGPPPQEQFLTDCSAVSYDGNFVYGGSLSGYGSFCAIRQFDAVNDWADDPGEQAANWKYFQFTGNNHHFFNGDPTGYVSWYMRYGLDCSPDEKDFSYLQYLSNRIDIERSGINAYPCDVLRNPIFYVDAFTTICLAGFYSTDIQIATDENFTNIVYNGSSLIEGEHKISPENGTFYNTIENRLNRFTWYWARCRYTDTAGANSNWSVGFKFMTGEKGCAYY